MEKMKMAKDMNTVVLTGRLVRECSLKESANTCYCNNTIAVNGYKDNDSSFIDLVAFGKTAEVISKFCSKGSFIGITGNIKQEKWTTQSGENRSKIIIQVESVKLLDSKKDSSNLDKSNTNKEPVSDGMNSNPRPGQPADWMNESIEEDIF